MGKSLSKKARKVIEENIVEFMQVPSLIELTKIGARMMLQAALEEEVRVFLERDYYERNPNAKGSWSGSKPRTVKIGCDDVEVRMPQARDAGSPLFF